MTQYTQHQQQAQTQETPKSFFSLWFRKTPGNERDVKNVRILHQSIQDIVQTTTHLRFFDRKDGKKGTYRVECLKKDYFGDYRDRTDCPLCKMERFPQTRKFWVWVEDLDQPGTIKYMELPYKVIESLETISQQVLSVGSPLWNMKFQIIKSGERLNTNYTVIPVAQEEPFDIQGLLSSLGLTGLPDLFGEPGGDGFPPIWRMNEHQVLQNAQGIHPWQLGNTAPAVQQAQTQSFEQHVGQQGFAGHTPKQVVQQPYPQYQQAPGPVNQEVAGAVPQPSIHNSGYPSNPAINSGQPVGNAIKSDPLPPSFNPEPKLDALQGHIPNVPYGSNGVQEQEEVADLESLDDSYTQLF